MASWNESSSNRKPSFSTAWRERLWLYLHPSYVPPEPFSLRT